MAQLGRPSIGMVLLSQLERLRTALYCALTVVGALLLDPIYPMASVAEDG
jgi:hypothetical protein